MTLADYTLLVARLGACLITSPEHGDSCARGWCFGAKDALALQMLYGALSQEQYDALVVETGALLVADNYPGKNTFRLPAYQDKSCIDCCFPASYLLRALAKVVQVEL